jgi:peroxiredoxin
MEPLSRKQRRAILCLGTAVFLLTLLLCFVAGVRREAQAMQQQMGEAARARFVLNYGETAPNFTLPTLAGGSLSRQDLQGRWSLLVFISLNCPACVKELTALQRLRTEGRLRLVVIVSGPGSGRGALLSRWYRKIGLNCPLLTDRENRVQNQFCDHPLIVPFSVLLDPDGKVRYLHHGYSALLSGESTLVLTLQRFFQGKDLLELERDGGHPSAPQAPDGRVTLQDGRVCHLSDLWKGRVLVLNFLSEHCPTCQVQPRELARFRQNPGSTRFLSLYRGIEDPDGPPAGGAVEVALDPSGEIFSRYAIKGVPHTVIIADGRRRVEISGALPVDNFWSSFMGRCALAGYLPSLCGSAMVPRDTGPAESVSGCHRTPQNAASSKRREAFSLRDSEGVCFPKEGLNLPWNFPGN